MGLFGSKNIFKNRQQIKDALYQIKTLDYRQRPTVYEHLVKELDDGGVSSIEIKEVVMELRRNGEISEVDGKNLLRLIRK